MKPYYITTPIYYPSGKFHIGSAYTTILVAMLKQYYKQRGYETYMLTGIDEHGQKIQTIAKQKQKTEQEYVNEMAQYAKKIWKDLDIDYDIFMRTTNDFHEKAVQKIFKKFLDNGDIYKGEYVGKYCIPCETYFTQSQLVDGKCPDCNRDVIDMKEESYFFNMKKYEKKLLDYYNEHEDFIYPKFRKTEMINNFLKDGLEDLSITRTSFDWGIKVPGDEKHVIYVWLDALTNYITALGYLQDDDENFKKYWPANTHVVGKDIARFHLIYWPIFLMALDLPLPKHIFVHNFIMMADGKMSKSKGNVIYPEDLANKYGIDSVKFTLLKMMSYTTDGLFTPEDFVNIYNDFLVNDLSNLINRTIGMANKYFDGKIKETKIIDQKDQELLDFTNLKKQEFESLISTFEISHALDKLFEIVSRTNKYIDEKEPWKLYKENDMESLNNVLYHLINNIRKIAILIKPILENTSSSIQKQYGFLNEDMEYSSLDNSSFSLNITKEPQIIFQRLDFDENVNYLKELMKK